jgi:hypothetical protein
MRCNAVLLLAAAALLVLVCCTSVADAQSERFCLAVRENLAKRHGVDLEQAFLIQSSPSPHALPTTFIYQRTNPLSSSQLVNTAYYFEEGTYQDYWGFQPNYYVGGAGIPNQIAGNPLRRRNSIVRIEVQMPSLLIRRCMPAETLEDAISGFEEWGAIGAAGFVDEKIFSRKLTFFDWANDLIITTSQYRSFYSNIYVGAKKRDANTRSVTDDHYSMLAGFWGGLQTFATPFDQFLPGWFGENHDYDFGFDGAEPKYDNFIRRKYVTNVEKTYSADGVHETGSRVTISTPVGKLFVSSDWHFDLVSRLFPTQREPALITQTLNLDYYGVDTSYYLTYLLNNGDNDRLI